ncbi:VWA domain-containing protein [bacterium]|nr:VWA domain-containing protein [bacterium]
MEKMKIASRQFESLRKDEKSEKNLEKDILSSFSKKEQKEIKYKQKVLSSLAYFIGKDFEIPVELNKPGAGWHWDFKANKIRIDPKDLLEKPMDYLRFVISHEGGHRRISRTDFIPLEIWKQAGFSFMMNAIEDPRDNNFVAENYPKFKEQMKLAYRRDLDTEQKAKEKAEKKLGYQPKFMQAGFEYIKQWYKETQGEENVINADLPEDVRKTVKETLESAKDSWWRYPSKKEADESEELIRKYAQVSYEINRDEIWPEFKKLVEEDMKDQEMQELMKDMQKGQGEGQGQPIPQELKDNSTPEEQKELEEAIDKAIEEAKKESASAKATADRQEKQKGEKGKEEKEKEKESESQAGEMIEKKPREGEPKGRPIDLDSLSEGLKQKIKGYIDSLPADKKKELQDNAEKEIKGLEKEINEEIEGKLSDNLEKKQERIDGEKTKEEIEKPEEEKSETDLDKEREKQRQSDLQKYKDILEKSLEKDANVYEEYRKEVLPIIEKLENDLREIFVARRASRWKSGFRTGKKINIKTRIQEKAKGVSVVESKAWQKRELPTEKDYAISILVDLSGSMSGRKIRETFKALIVLAEVLNKLSIKTEILGFNDRLYEYQTFGENLSREIRENMGGVLKEVNNHQGGRADYNDDGWALQETSKRLAKQRANEKFAIVLSDGLPEESSAHSGPEFDLGRIVNRIMQETDQKLIGLGIGSGTRHVKEFYPNSLADIDVKEMAEKLAGVIKEMIVNYQNF